MSVQQGAADGRFRIYREILKAPRRRPRGIGSWSRETLYQNHVKVSIPSTDLLEGIETLTWFWYHNNKWPRKEQGRTFNLSINYFIHDCEYLAYAAVCLMDNYFYGAKTPS